MPNTFLIDGKRIGPGEPVYLVAEMSANHAQSFDKAMQIIYAAKVCGADAVKLQTFTPDTITLDCHSEHFRISNGSPWNGRILYDLYQEAQTPWSWHKRLKEYANGLGLTLFSSPFDPDAVQFLEDLGMPVYKIASFEITDLYLLESIAQTGKPIILSTGMASLAEIREAVDVIKKHNRNSLALLKCTSAYPATPEEMNLRTIPDLQTTFDLPVGLSDHSLGIAVPIAAVALGACIIEKHLTLSRQAESPDNCFSLEPHEFKAMVAAVRTAEKALGEVSYSPTIQEAKNLVFRRSIHAIRDIRIGEPLSVENVRSIRPEGGLHPRHLQNIIGKRAVVDIPRGTPLQWTHLTSNDKKKKICVDSTP
ncbi:MAG: pseudaminic acid synthase [bacterium]